MLESLLAIRRAGADVIATYFAKDFARLGGWLAFFVKFEISKLFIEGYIEHNYAIIFYQAYYCRNIYFLLSHIFNSLLRPG
jgi:hypothetical protein